MTEVFPATIIMLSIAACLVYMINKDYGRAIYWGAGALITASATWWIK